MKNSLEFLRWNVSLSQDIMVEEELSESDSVFLDIAFDLLQESVKLWLSIKLPLSSSVVASFDCIVRGIPWSWVSQELKVLYVVLLVSVRLNDSLDFLVSQMETKSS